MTTSDLETIFEFTLLTSFSIFLILHIVGYIDARYIKVNDLYRGSVWILTWMQLSDIFGDAFVSVDIYYKHNSSSDEFGFLIAFIASITFIILPSMLSIYQLRRHYIEHWLNDDRIRLWWNRYSKLLYLMSIISGSSFTAIGIMNGSMFGLEMFEMGLSKKQKRRFKTKRLYSVVIFENIPQFALQIWLFTQSGGLNIITGFSSTFSMISILVTIMGSCNTKMILHSQEYSQLTLDVTGDMDTEKCRKRVNRIRYGVARVIGLDSKMMEVMKPVYIPKGLQLQINNYVNNKAILQSKANGQLAGIIARAWGIDDILTVSNLQCKLVQSENTVHINV